ncbi:MAG TPA: cyclic nucleotide-binding domain-containing protein, partial [Trueperaceae bacterium]|nr:cyclic nucleotide-binding domain-containing protein [Trueperaceae bacterium]
MNSDAERLEILELLRRVPLFIGAPDRALDIAAAAVRKRAYEAGATMFQEGDKGEALYIIASGLVKLSKVDLGGHEKTLAILQCPEYFGEM